jgi:hypothetical protein
MRDRYEREEDDHQRDRRPGEPGARRDEPVYHRRGGWDAGDERGEQRGGYGRYDDRDRYDERRRDDRDVEAGDDWGDVQVGRWARGHRASAPYEGPDRRDRDESYWSGTTGRWARDLEREPPPWRADEERSRHGDDRGWRGAVDVDRDWQAPRRKAGRFAGVAPKGYHRSDERIRDDVCDRLTDDAWVDPSDVEVRVQNGDVSLEGTVDARETKRRIEDIVDDVAGVREVHNALRIAAHGAPSGSSPAGPGAGSRS